MSAYVYHCTRRGCLANGPKRAGGLETVVLEDYAMAAKNAAKVA